VAFHLHEHNIFFINVCLEDNSFWVKSDRECFIKLTITVNAKRKFEVLKLKQHTHTHTIKTYSWQKISYFVFTDTLVMQAQILDGFFNSKMLIY